MKITAFYCLILIALAACDPREPFGAYEDTTPIIAKIINPRDSIGVNDTVRVLLEAPDSIMVNGSYVHVTYTSKDMAGCNINIYKMDSTHGGSTAAIGSITGANIGYLTPVKTIIFQKVG